jgi:hypothetical protein
MRWTGPGWLILQKFRRVKASKRIHDPSLDFSDLLPPVVLTIGRSCNLFDRLRQHFSDNPNNNRVWKRLVEIAPSLPHDQLRELIIQDLVVDWVVISGWVERCVLERYGCAVHRPIFDIDAEH